MKSQTGLKLLLLYGDLEIVFSALWWKPREADIAVTEIAVASRSATLGASGLGAAETCAMNLSRDIRFRSGVRPAHAAWIHVLTHMKSLHAAMTASVAHFIMAETPSLGKLYAKVNFASVLPEIQAYYALRCLRDFSMNIERRISNDAREILRQIDPESPLLIEEAEEYRLQTEAALAAIPLILAKRALIARFAVPLAVNAFFIRRLADPGL